MSASPTETLLSRIDRSDLSCLVALRVLTERTRGDGWTGADDLARGIHERYSEIALDPAAGRGLSAPPIALAGHDAGEPSEYVRQQVIPRLVEAGLVEFREASDHDGAAVRVSPALGEDRAQLAGEIDTRIHRLAAAEPAPATRPLGGAAQLPESTLSAAGLVKVYRKRKVVNDVAVRVSQGEIVGLLGPNGAGKTTTFYMMVGLIAPDAGRVSIGAADVTDVPMYRRARKGIGYLAQEPSIFRKLTVEQNVRAILQMMKFSRAEQEKRLEQLLDELGIKHLRHSKAYALSGGERRRLEITRALVGEPKFMLLDEPFAGVDPIAVHDIQQIVADLRRRNIGVLISDHNVEQTLDIVDRAYIMYDGRVRVSGTVSELVWNDEVAEIYLGPTLTARMRQRYAYPE